MIVRDKMQIEAINCGTVIDHISVEIGLKILALFRLMKTGQRIIIGLNLPSRILGRKDLIKIENIFLTDDQVNQLSFYAPYSTINLIYDYNIVEKIAPKLPEHIERVLICPNNNCISRSELVYSSFQIRKREKVILLKCKYCEKEFSNQEILANW